MKNNPLPRNKLIRKLLTRFIMTFLIMGLMFFLSAGTLNYPEAWIYLTILFIPMLLGGLYLLKNDPELLERRMRMKEKTSEQKLLIKLSFIPFFLTYLLPGFDQRFGWSNLPGFLIFSADILVLTGYGIVFLTFRENRYASRVVEVEQGQAVISSGPYALVRHPMYVGSILLYVLTPLALGSLWAMIPASLIIPFIIARIINEEKVLVKELKGYSEYIQKTRYRLVPGLW